MKWVVALIAIIAVTSNVFTCNGLEKWKARYEVYRDSTAALLVRSDSLENVARISLSHADSLRLVASRQTQHINVLTARLRAMGDSADVLNDSLAKLVKIYGPINPITCQFCLRTNAYLNAQIDTFRLTVDSLNRRDTTRVLTIDSLTSAIRLDTLIINDLQEQLRHLPKPPPLPRLFGLFHINANQAFMAGAVVTVGSILVLRK